MLLEVAALIHFPWVVCAFEVLCILHIALINAKKPCLVLSSKRFRVSNLTFKLVIYFNFCE